MIVRPSGPSQLLITQPDHAALAGRIMREWHAGELQTSPRRPEILLAIDQHDNGWAEVDVDPIVDPTTGRIFDFVSAPAQVRRSVWPRGIERLSATPYAAALVAQHALHIYARFRSDTDWMPFFSEIESARDRHLRAAADATFEELQRDYVFVRLGDLASLVFCTAWQEPQAEAGYSIRLDGTRVVIAPDPFGGRGVPIEVRARELPDRPFSSSADAHRTMSAAPQRVVSGIACGEAAV
ncbi:MAG TPA: DUF3891 family protein [Vicinamibacterales bacterium]|nr:DUF3891 family protein [Vicinamibacterales bacterium]